MLLQVGRIRVPVALCTNPVGQDAPPPQSEGQEPNQKTAGPAEEDDEKIPHPTLELYRHTLLRGANAGSLLTLVFGIPVLLYRGVRQPAEMVRRLASASTKGVGVGMGLVALLTYMKIHDQTDEQIFDRCYRLRYNKGQVRTDKFTYAGAVTGGLIGLAAMPEARALGGLHGACVGVGLAVFAHVLTKPLTKGKEK